MSLSNLPKTCPTGLPTAFEDIAQFAYEGVALHNRPGTAEMARRANRSLVEAAHRRIYHHPDDALDDLLRPDFVLPTPALVGFDTSHNTQLRDRLRPWPSGTLRILANRTRCRVGNLPTASNHGVTGSSRTCPDRKGYMCEKG